MTGKRRTWSTYASLRAAVEAVVGVNGPLDVLVELVRGVRVQAAGGGLEQRSFWRR